MSAANPDYKTIQQGMTLQTKYLENLHPVYEWRLYFSDCLYLCHHMYSNFLNHYDNLMKNLKKATKKQYPACYKALERLILEIPPLSSEKYMEDMELLESAEREFISFKAQLPIFIQRQLCLSGDTELHFVNGYNNEYKRKEKIEEVYRIYQNGGRNKQQIQNRKLLKYNPNTQAIETTNIKHIWQSGMQYVYKISFKYDTQDIWVKITSNHQFLTENGWKALEDIYSKNILENKMISIDDLKTIKTPKVYAVVQSQEKQEKCNYTHNIINTLEEVWVDLYGFQQFYEISNQGRVRNKITKQMKNTMNCHMLVWSLNAMGLTTMSL